jgi:hypothetical protein
MSLLIFLSFSPMHNITEHFIKKKKKKVKEKKKQPSTVAS